MKPVIGPLKSLEEVLHWEGPQCYEAASLPYTGPDTLPTRPRTLVCHDMDGGYLHDRFVQGVDTSEAYRFFHWQHVDVFVYFAHHLITVPPPCWTNTAHRHNVLMLGTFITEWDDGKKICEQFLSSEEAYKSLADKMVLIAVQLGFDGWLINIENIIQPVENVDRLRSFVSYLTSAMHATVRHSLVIWYDSVTTTGELIWQNKLNHANRQFFDACDGIFLNYTWDEAGLSESAEMAADRGYDVYVGADVFGRGCPGGGGYNTKEALSKARQFVLSSAIFAQGWTYQKLPKEDLTQNDIKFWKLLQEYCTRHATAQSLPVATSFCQGYGHGYYRNGECISDDPWSNLSCQRLQPCSWSGQGMEQGMGYHTAEAYEGGGCLRLTASGNAKYSLLSTKLPVPSESTLYVCLVYKNLHPSLPQISLNLISSDQSQCRSLGDGEGCIKPSDPEELQRVFKVGYTTISKNQPKTGWTQKEFVVRDTAVYDIVELGISVQSEEKEDYDILLGKLQISTTTLMNEVASSSILLKKGSSQNSLQWVVSTPFDFYTVHSCKTEHIKDAGSWCILGQVHCCSFILDADVTELKNDDQKDKFAYKVLGWHSCGLSVESNEILL